MNFLLIPKSMFKSFSLFFGNGKIFFLSLIPIILSIVISITLATQLYALLLGLGKTWMAGFIASTSLLKTFDVMFSLILGGLLFILSHWIVLILVSFISFPFNDAISAIIAKKLEPSAAEIPSVPFFRKLKSELLKFSFILFCTVFSILLAFIPPLTPIAVIITSTLISIQFLDISWSRQQLPFKACLHDLKENFVIYFFSGFCFLFIYSIPLINYFFIAAGTIYYTVLWISCKNHS